MEVLRGYDASAKFTIPGSAINVTYRIVQNGTQIGSVSNPTVDTGNGLATASIPYKMVHVEGQFDVELSFTVGPDNFTVTEHVTVVTPILELRDIKTVWPTYDNAEATKMEMTVRHQIESYCGQRFGQETKTLTVRGTGEDALRLPERLMVLTGLGTLTTTLDINDSIITSDGWYLKKGWTSGNDYHETTNLYFGTDDISFPPVPVGEPGYEKPDHGAVINAPGVSTKPTVWRVDYPFTVTGLWGYSAVPGPVRDAALLLVNDYGCNEIIYRDKFLESTKFADTSMGFSPASWSGSTGNARADALLSDYVIADWAVL